MKIAYINDFPYEIKEGESILGFVKRNVGDNFVPTLCDAPNLEAFGACRVCSVEVAMTLGGKSRVVASCHTPLAEGMHVYTGTEKLKDSEKILLN